MRLGIDLGGTKIAAVVIDAQGGVRWSARAATPRGDYEATLSAIAALVAEGEQAAGARCSVGIGTPGALSPTSDLIKNANSTWLNGRPLKADLESRLARPIRMLNDANCLALSEAADGAATGVHVVFGVILGTGVGGGLVIDGRPLIGANAIAGEWGHNPLPWPRDDERPGASCYCGRSGCIETFLSGPGLSEDYRRRGGASASAELIVERAGAGDPLAVATLSDWHDRLARALATVINLVDPDVVVVGGGLSRIVALYDEVPRRWGAWVFSDRVETRLVPARHGDASGVRGAARLW